jgi:hypothetical protein
MFTLLHVIDIDLVQEFRYHQFPAIARQTINCHSFLLLDAIAAAM